MSTNCLIAMQNETGIEGITCHWDGYPEWVGELLEKKYASTKQASALIALGNISSLGAEIAPPDGVTHTFD